MKTLFAIAALFTAISIGCTNKSANSQSLTNDNAPAASAQTDNAAVADKPAQDKQEKPTCGLALNASPAVNGIRLGMTPDEVFALFPGSKDDKTVRASLAALTPFGNSTFVIKPMDYESKDKFAGINSITFKVLDGRVSSFSIAYNGPEYAHVDKFVAKFSEGRNLPAVDQWEAYAGMDTQMKTLRCTEFEVQVFAGGQGGSLNKVMIQDMLADRKLRDRKAKARANATPSPEKQ